MVCAIEYFSKQGEGRQAYLLVSVLTPIPFAMFTVAFNEEQLFFLPFKLQLQKLAHQWQDCHCPKTETEAKQASLVAGREPAD